jgi:3-oxoacyl-[acyl-carrier protein] reductase
MITIDLSGRTALVTGATGELGRVIVRTLAEAGADVAIHYARNRAKAEELVEECRGNGRTAMMVQADITSKPEIAAMRETVTAALGAPDVIVNNAVIQYEWTSVLEQSESDYESQFRSCVLQNVMMAKAFVPAMIERKWGRVIGINTECTMQAVPSQSAYISGKAGMDRVLRVLAREIGGHGITVNQVAPGWTISENRSGEGTPQWYIDSVALKRRGTDQEIANAVVFLASDLASFISGVYLPVCGGTVMPAI